ncbi:uncharacterized protein EV420DRAFT_1749018 [Desarmillaria tabescens]|uniref:Uncharacterized protein n=1 Tax=Armillaria tabescens TaxID=1929756 RepID=A0AA39KE59_ARMTA|nr:uncharacterized protein EV420DRAFT_1749018 [Desarmillaria tabescens]KAK0457153.1 hypothetical protein EV420DRAFT_1749018 [Desarmillaria tabescens]
MSADWDSAKYPHTKSSGLPPYPCPENPGQVYPHTDPNKAKTPPLRRTSEPPVGNPFFLNDALRKLDSSLGNVIQILEQEEAAATNNRLLRKFVDMRDELDRIRTGRKVLTPSHVSPERDTDGGLFVD